jgi:hypothetical protein
MLSPPPYEAQQRCFYCRILHTLLKCNAYAEFGRCQTPQALIIAPTRELAIQIKVGQGIARNQYSGFLNL